MTKDLHLDLFKKYASTFYLPTFQFPKKIQDEVMILYSFVRLADEGIDNPTELEVELSEVAPDFDEMTKRNGIPKRWVMRFLASMRMDLTVKSYPTFEDLKKYTYGSSEVIGLMMAKIMGVPKQGYKFARSLGLSMQLINFLRDVDEDLERGRIYIPLEDLAKFGINKEEWGKNMEVEKLRLLVNFEAERINKIQKQAEAGFKYIPKESRQAVIGASEGYQAILFRIVRNPSLIWEGTNRSSNCLQTFSNGLF